MRISAPRSSCPLVRGGRIKRRILGDVPGVAQRGGSIFPRRATSTCPLALPPELDVGRSVGPARSRPVVQSLLPSGTHVPCPDRTRLCRARDYSLSLSLSFSGRPQHPTVPESPRINRADSTRERYL